MLVTEGKIVAIGSMDEVLPTTTKKVSRVDLQGQTVLPGFIDVHTHFALSMFMAGMHDLSGFTHSNNASVWNSFESLVAESSDDEWLVCKGIDPILVDDLQLPSLSYLDSLAPSNPVIIFSQSLHSYWANSKAFELAGLTPQTPNPSDHSYYAKDEHGNFTGLIVEQEALMPFVEVLKKEVLTAKFLSDMSLKVMQDYAHNGNTTIVSTGLAINESRPLIMTKHLSNESPSLLSNFLSKLGMLPAREPLPRHFIYLRYDVPHLMPTTKKENDFYNIIGIKHWYDGSPYIGTMYMNEPYLETDLTKNKLDIQPGARGEALVGRAALKEFIREYHAQGWQIALHAQGDAAIQEIIDAYSELEGELDYSTSRHRLEHCMLLTSSQLDDLKRLNLTPSFHINHIYYYGEALNNEILGESRTHKTFPIRSALDKDLISTLHSDQPMFESQPFRLLQSAVERKTKEGNIIGEAERIDLLAALKAVTINAAWQINMEDKLGSLEVNKYADFVIVDSDPFTISADKLASIICLQTYINGNLVERIK